METKFNFNSQICTAKEQSDRLLSLGLKKETADMCWLDHALTDDYQDWRETPIYKEWEEWQRDGIPAWSLHRLLCIIPKYIQVPDNVWEYKHDLYLSIDEELHVRYYEEGVDEPCFDKSFLKDDLYQNCVDVIKWLIKEGHFNKEYLA